MAKTATPAATVEGEVRVKRTRSPSPPRPIYAVVQVLDENGEPIKLDKANIRIVSFERSAEEVLSKIESGAHPHAVYLKGLIPAGR